MLLSVVECLRVGVDPWSSWKRGGSRKGRLLPLVKEVSDWQPLLVPVLGACVCPRLVHVFFLHILALLKCLFPFPCFLLIPKHPLLEGSIPHNLPRHIVDDRLVGLFHSHLSGYAGLTRRQSFVGSTLTGHQRLRREVTTGDAVPLEALLDFELTDRMFVPLGLVGVVFVADHAAREVVDRRLVGTLP